MNSVTFPLFWHDSSLYLEGGGRIRNSLVWTHDWMVAGLSPSRSGEVIFFSRVNFLS